MKKITKIIIISAIAFLVLWVLTAMIIADIEEAKKQKQFSACGQLPAIINFSMWNENNITKLPISSGSPESLNSSLL